MTPIRIASFYADWRILTSNPGLVSACPNGQLSKWPKVFRITLNKKNGHLLQGFAGLDLSLWFIAGKIQSIIAGDTDAVKEV
jgi:hypothetical protein